jgi:predicted DNA-binding protein (MmcQ/YjbR family)
MFALANLDRDSNGVLSFATGPDKYHELLETEGVFPAPYMARIFWVAIERYDVFPSRELEQLLRNAHNLTFAKLPKRTRDFFAMPVSQRKKLITARRELLQSSKKPK